MNEETSTKEHPHSDFCYAEGEHYVYLFPDTAKGFDWLIINILEWNGDLGGQSGIIVTHRKWEYISKYLTRDGLTYKKWKTNKQMI